MSVRARRRVVRLINRAPRCSSRSATRRVTTAGERFISRAAAAKLPESMTRQKTRIECSLSIKAPPDSFGYWNAVFDVKCFIDRRAMPTVHPIDEPNKPCDSPRLDKTVKDNQARLPGIRNPLVSKDILMNAKHIIATLSV